MRCMAMLPAAMLMSSAGRDLPTSLAEMSLGRIQPAGVASSCAPSGLWTDASLAREFRAALARIASAPLEREPFPHLRVQGLFSDCLYHDMLEQLPAKSAFEASRYSGTMTHKTLMCLPRKKLKRQPPGAFRPLQVPSDCCSNGSQFVTHDDRLRTCKKARCFLQKRQLSHAANDNHGWVLMQSMMTADGAMPLWVQLQRLVHSADFMTLLVRRFSLADGDGIPAWKRERLRDSGGETTLRNSAALRIDPAWYQIAPHLDVWQKLVTWQFFHPVDDSLATRGVGTQFMRPGRAYAGKFAADDSANPPWFEWEVMELVKEMPVARNTFFAFAPNNRSWHAASMRPSQLVGIKPDSRRNFLGFVTSEAFGYHGFQDAYGDYADRFFWLSEQSPRSRGGLS